MTNFTVEHAGLEEHFLNRWSGLSNRQQVWFHKLQTRSLCGKRGWCRRWDVSEVLSGFRTEIHRFLDVRKTKDQILKSAEVEELNLSCMMLDQAE